VLKAACELMHRKTKWNGGKKTETRTVRIVRKKNPEVRREREKKGETVLF